MPAPTQFQPLGRGGRRREGLINVAEMGFRLDRHRGREVDHAQRPVERFVGPHHQVGAFDSAGMFPFARVLGNHATEVFSFKRGTVRARSQP